jgi:hypothetical protein
LTTLIQRNAVVDRAMFAAPVQKRPAADMSKINAAWHRAHPMPKNPTLDQRIEWHLAHARACGCRKIEGKLLAEMKRRGITVPVFGAA